MINLAIIFCVSSIRILLLDSVPDYMSLLTAVIILEAHGAEAAQCGIQTQGSRVLAPLRLPYCCDANSVTSLLMQPCDLLPKKDRELNPLLLLSGNRRRLT
jgi:hypothetical protein